MQLVHTVRWGKPCPHLRDALDRAGQTTRPCEARRARSDAASAADLCCVERRGRALRQPTRRSRHLQPQQARVLGQTAAEEAAKEAAEKAAPPRAPRPGWGNKKSV